MAAHGLYQIIIIVQILTITKSQLGTPNLPRADYFMATGHNNGTIHILGGHDYGYQLIEYDIERNEFEDNVSALTNATYGMAQFYTQIGHILYMIDPDGDKLSIYNMETKTFINHWNGIIIPINVGFWGCLASTEDYLFILDRDFFEILNISQSLWISGAPSMNASRYLLSCIVHPSTNRLYAIGGRHYVDTFESISILGDITMNNWIISQKFINGIAYGRCIIHHEFIWVLGGYYYGTAVPYIQVIDTSNDDMIQPPIYGKYLNYSVYGAATVIVDNVIYLFGGLGIFSSFTVTLNTWQYFNISPTPSPTTSNPTIATNNPTIATNIPTAITLSPTTFDPTTSDPTTSDPTTFDPTTSDPTTFTPTTPMPSEFVIQSTSFTAETSQQTVECPTGCSLFFWDGCNACLCDDDGTYTQDSCTNTECGDEKEVYCDKCNSDTFLCDDGTLVGRSLDDKCEFKECESYGDNVVTYGIWGSLFVASTALIWLL